MEAKARILERQQLKADNAARLRVDSERIAEVRARSRNPVSEPYSQSAVDIASDPQPSRRSGRFMATFTALIVAMLTFALGYWVGNSSQSVIESPVKAPDIIREIPEFLQLKMADDIAESR